MMICHSSSSSPGSVTLRSLGGSRELATFRPADDLVGTLPEDPHLELKTMVTSDACRFVRHDPAMGAVLFRDTASMLGHSIRARDDDWDLERWNGRLVERHAFDFVTGSKRFLKTRFTSWQSFNLRKQLRLTTGLVDQLPEDFGMKEDGTGRLSPTQLAKIGRQAAQQHGLVKPKPIDVVAYGFLAAAQRRTTRLTDEKIEELVRSVLFDESCVEAKSCPVRTATVARHLDVLLRRHLEGERSRFTRWFAGGSSNLVKALMTRCRAHGAEMTRDQVRRALLDLAWRGCRETAANIEAFALGFIDAMNLAQIPFEVDDFKAIYCRQSHFGGLSLIMLIDGRGFLKPAVDLVLARPNDPESIAAMHGVMQSYSQAAQRSRHVERIKKRFGLIEGNLGGTEAEERRPDELRSRRASPPDFAEIVDEILERRKITCKRCGEQPTGRLSPKSSGDRLRLCLRCRTHGYIRMLNITTEDVRIARDRRGGFGSKPKKSNG